MTEIQLWEAVQQTFTNRICGLENMNYWERLSHLKLMSLSLQRRRERYTILMMWKILHNAVPNCINIRFTKTSRNGTRPIIPSLSRLSSLSNQTLYKSSIAVRGPKLWNKVPDSINNTVRQYNTIIKLKLLLSCLKYFSK